MKQKNDQLWFTSATDGQERTGVVNENMNENMTCAGIPWSVHGLCAKTKAYKYRRM